MKIFEEAVAVCRFTPWGRYVLNLKNYYIQIKQNHPSDRNRKTRQLKLAYSCNQTEFLMTRAKLTSNSTRLPQPHPSRARNPPSKPEPHASARCPTSPTSLRSSFPSLRPHPTATKKFRRQNLRQLTLSPQSRKCSPSKRCPSLRANYLRLCACSWISSRASCSFQWTTTTRPTAR